MTLPDRRLCQERLERIFVEPLPQRGRLANQLASAAEAVFTAGAIDEARASVLEAWAAEQGIARDSCRYLSAFAGRTAAPFRRAVSTLAVDSYAWFLDEPELVLHFRRLGGPG